MNGARSEQMMRDGLRAFYLTMQRIDGRAAGMPRSEECANAVACIAYSVLVELTAGDPARLIGLIAALMNNPTKVIDVYVGPENTPGEKGN